MEEIVSCIQFRFNEFLNDGKYFFCDKLFSAPSWDACVIWFSFYLIMFVCYFAIPCKHYKGVLLADGKSRLSYPINGLATFVVVLLVFVYGHLFRLWSLTFAYDHFWPLFQVVQLYSIAMSFFLLFKARLWGGVRTGHSWLYDFWHGAELNPRIGSFDFKFFFYRPLIIGWAMLILSMAAKQYEETGGVSRAMALYVLFTWWYTIDYLAVEEKMVTTWDIIAEHLGFGLTWGDHLFFPFYYSLHGHWILRMRDDVPFYAACLITAFWFTGYVIFRQCNSQKDAFKTKGKEARIWGEPPRTTKAGHLLTSGWWGVARHANYLGDIMMSLGWTMPVYPSAAWMPWSNSVLFFIPFLMHREYRDEKRCKEKYKKEWDEYRQAVPYRILPGVY